VHKFPGNNGFLDLLHQFHNKLATMMDPDRTTWDACEPKYSQLPFFSSTLKSMVAVGNFFNVEQHIFCIVSYEMILVGDKHARVLLYFKESGIMKALIFSGARRDLLQTNLRLQFLKNDRKRPDQSRSRIHSRIHKGSRTVTLQSNTI
jgi:hypothetical protein